jgi:hypothetical protein
MKGHTMNYTALLPLAALFAFTAIAQESLKPKPDHSVTIAKTKLTDTRLGVELEEFLILPVDAKHALKAQTNKLEKAFSNVKHWDMIESEKGKPDKELAKKDTVAK